MQLMDALEILNPGYDEYTRSFVCTWRYEIPDRLYLNYQRKCKVSRK